MSWQIYADDNITITGTSNGYFTVTVRDDLDDVGICFDVEHPIYFNTLAKAFEQAAQALTDQKTAKGN
jgi:hypothetical protein